jgi:hypothetical protein
MLDEAVAVFPDLEWFNNDRRPYVPQKMSRFGVSPAPTFHLLATTHLKELRLSRLALFTVTYLDKLSIASATQPQFNPSILPTHVPQQKITELGFTVPHMSELRKCKMPAEFKTIFAKAQKFHIRIAEHCHLRNDELGLKDAEQHSLYCETRFVSEEDTKKIFIDFPSNIWTKDGHLAPVILVRHGWNNDEDKVIDHWNLRPSKLPGVVKTVKSLARLAQQVFIIPASDYAAGKPNPKIEEMLTDFGVDFTNIWSHNGANDAVHQMTFALLCKFYSMLFPDTTSGFPKNPAIAEQTINEIFQELETLKP